MKKVLYSPTLAAEEDEARRQKGIKNSHNLARNGLHTAFTQGCNYVGLPSGIKITGLLYILPGRPCPSQRFSSQESSHSSVRGSLCSSLSGDCGLCYIVSHCCSHFSSSFQAIREALTGTLPPCAQPQPQARSLSSFELRVIAVLKRRVLDHDWIGASENRFV